MKTHLLLLLLRWRHLRLLGASTAINDLAEEQALILYLLQQELKFVPSRNRKVFNNALSLLEKRRRKGRIPRSCLHHPNESAWRQVLNGGDDGALITLTGLDFEVLVDLHSDFKTYYDNISPHCTSRLMKVKKVPGRSRLMTSLDCLGLCLPWTRTSRGMFVLSMIFGMTASFVSA